MTREHYELLAIVTLLGFCGAGIIAALRAGILRPFHKRRRPAQKARKDRVLGDLAWIGFVALMINMVVWTLFARTP